MGDAKPKLPGNCSCGSSARVEFMDPNAVLDLVNRAEVSRIAGEVRQRLERVLQAL